MKRLLFCRPGIDPLNNLKPDNQPRLLWSLSAPQQSDAWHVAYACFRFLSAAAVMPSISATTVSSSETPQA